MSLSDIASAGMNHLTSSTPKKNLKDFLKYFSSIDGQWIKTIDPMSTFDLRFYFHPNKNDIGISDGTSPGFWDKVGGAAVDTLKDIGNSVTGGLLGNAFNKEVIESRKNFIDETEGISRTFVEYLVESQLLKWDDKNGLVLDLGLYCQSITIPNFSIENETATTVLGPVPIIGQYVRPDSQTLNFELLNTKVPLHERLFYPWMMETQLDYWVYDTQPYTTADIEVDFTKHNSIKYKFFGCRPIQINNQQPNQQHQGIKRNISMSFEYMAVMSDLQNMDSVLSKLGSLAGTVVQGAASMININAGQNK